MDWLLKITMSLVFFTMGATSFVFTDMLRKFWSNFMIAHETAMLKIPLFGLFARGFIFWFEQGAGRHIVYLSGALWVFVALIILLVL